MTAGEKRALANWYLTWEATGRRPKRSEIDRLYPYRNADVTKLIARGLMEIMVDRSGNDVIDITPQGKAVAKMILGLTRPKRGRRGRKANPRRRRKTQEVVPIELMYRKKDLNTAERVILDLAVAIHRRRSKASAVSWQAQVEAGEYFRKHGLEKTMDRVVELGGPE